MAIVIKDSIKTTPRDEAMADAIAMIEEAVMSKIEISPFQLATMILERVENGMNAARNEADMSVEDEVIGEIEGFAKNADEWDVLATSGNILAIVRQSFDEKWGRTAAAA